MSRSLKKGPYINVKLEKKVLAMNESGKKVVVKTWARASMISPDFVGHTVAVICIRFRVLQQAITRSASWKGSGITTFQLHHRKKGI